MNRKKTCSEKAAPARIIPSNFSLTHSSITLRVDLGLAALEVSRQNNQRCLSSECTSALSQTKAKKYANLSGAQGRIRTYNLLITN